MSGQTNRAAPAPSAGLRPSMEGPDNRPARPKGRCLNGGHNLILQWRAGQSSGQTR